MTEQVGPALKFLVDTLQENQEPKRLDGEAVSLIARRGCTHQSFLADSGASRTIKYPHMEVAIRNNSRFDLPKLFGFGAKPKALIFRFRETSADLETIGGKSDSSASYWSPQQREKSDMEWLRAMANLLGWSKRLPPRISQYTRASDRTEAFQPNQGKIAVCLGNMREAGEIDQACYDKAMEVVAAGRAWMASESAKSVDVTEELAARSLPIFDAGQPSAVERLVAGGARPGQLHR